MRAVLETLEAGAPAELPALLAFAAGQGVPLDADELHAAIRRSELLLATGGDPRRAPDPDDRAVTALADDLDAPEARAALAAGLERLADDSEGLPAVSAVLAELRADEERAWRCYAWALLAEHVGGDR